MTSEEREQMRRWVETWKQAGPELEAIRVRELQESDNRKAIRIIFGEGPMELSCDPKPVSGLVEMQKWFAKLPR